MDMIRTGKFIAELRKEKGLTQEQFGEQLGVTNKTVSRWETGVYLPPADILIMMSELFDVSINELLTGKRLSAEDYRYAAEENLKATVRESTFTLNERISFFRTKWLTEHIAVMVFTGICIIGVFAAGIIMRHAVVISLACLLLLAAHVWRNHAMMVYVEKHAFDGSGS